ncbi:hypothetical protein AXK11_00190 [Cephaloticoccus primus]|uniref:DUF2191 domain-containing protein n=1 Tax=Cephaloticoccus primus TaxID=1548207 RepID=A0A139ST86_9BACT|nr:type II toxin-antitoxin system VapB family antitoxin [Cephaloticoccus primus]KXU37692.1 hypothetical protein AXK11_00190 [Cephaloticoccus primus]
MKITVEVDDALLAEVKEFTGCKTNEDTIRYALKDTTEHPWMKEYYSSPYRIDPEDLVDALYPDYDPKAIWGRPAPLPPAAANPEAPSPHENAASAGQ